MSENRNLNPMLQRKRTTVYVVSAILLVTLFCLYPILSNGWVNWDDPAYVLRNRMIWQLSADAVSDMFTTPEVVGLYHPLTLLSLAVDYHFWKLEPFGFHLTNLVLHLLNTLLVFVLFRKLGASVVVAGIVSLLFGIHPMHVESVAWVSARKDVLYVCFFLVGLLSYISYMTRNKLKWFWYSAAIASFSLSLLSKNIAFTFPLILLLIDYLRERSFSWRLIFEKLPFFLLSGAAIIMAKYGQQASDSMEGLSTISYDNTILTGVYNISFYLYKCILPVQLSAFHPFPLASEPQSWHYLALIPFAGLLYFIYWSFKKSRKLFFGILFFLITIGPLLQIIPFGKAISSERYTYLSYIGLFYIIAIAFSRFITSSGKTIRITVIGVFFTWIIFLSIQTNLQSRVWNSSESLWTQVIDQYPDSHWALMTRGIYYVENEEYSLALEDLNKSIEIYPFAQSLYERGKLYEKARNQDLAMQDYKRSLELDPEYSKSLVNLGVLFAQYEQLDEAMFYLNKAIETDPGYSLAHFNYATALKIKGDHKNALKYYTNAIELEPDNARYLIYRGVLYTDLKQPDNAIKDFNRAIALSPNAADIYYLRAVNFEMKHQYKKALRDARKAYNLGYRYPPEENYIKKLQKLLQE